MDKILNYGNYGIFLIMGNAGFCPSTVGFRVSGLGDSRGVGFEADLGFWVTP